MKQKEMRKTCLYLTKGELQKLEQLRKEGWNVSQLVRNWLNAGLAKMGMKK